MRSRENQVKEIYAGLGWVSFFINVRFWTGSFAEVERHIPASGVILDVGCGYGIFSNYLALSSLRRTVIGVDLDQDKLLYADRGVKNTSFRFGDATRMRFVRLNGIVLLDVLHHVGDHQTQEKLVKACAAMLVQGGKLIISEVDSKPLWKLILARFVDGMLYPGQRVYYGYRERLFPLLQKYFGTGNVKVATLRRNPFPHLVYICQKPQVRNFRV